jgi:hypothetical protein
MPAMAPTTIYLPPHLESPHVTLGVMVLFAIVVPGLALVWALVARARHLLHASEARQDQERARAATQLGPIVLAGKVDDDGQGPAITIDIDQRGRDRQYKGNWSTEWIETGRSVTVRPFYVVRPSGERVRVEPDERVFLVDKLDALEVTGGVTRRRSARLTAGELVFVVGTATHGFDPARGGYRDGAVGPVVRPSRGQRMLISTEPLVERHRRQARDDGKLALLLLAWLLVANGAVFLREWTLRLAGDVVPARVIDTRTWSSYVKPRNGPGHWVTHYGVTVQPPLDPDLRFETSHGLYREAHDATAPLYLPLLVAGPFRQLGNEPAASDIAIIIYPPLTLAFLLGVVAWRRSRRPWYLRARIVERLAGRLDAHRVQLK